VSEIRNLLGEEERAEYDDLMFKARFYDDGKSRPSHEIADRMHDLLEDAIQAGRQWAQWVMDDDARAGHLSRSKKWDRSRRFILTREGEVIVKRSAVMAIQRRNPDTQETGWFDTEWVDMTVDELMQVITESRRRQESARETVAIARKLVRLINEAGVETVGEALEQRGMSIDEYLLLRDAA
jgi:uncharacterized Ntn-hydrolase superfamily protein